MLQEENLIVDTYCNYDKLGLLVGFNQREEEYFYLRDITGNINKIVDKNGNVMVKYNYDA